MRRSTLAAIVAVLVAAALAIGYGAGASAKAEDSKKEKEAPPAAGAGSEIEPMKMLEGNWDAKMTMKGADAPAVESKGALTARLGCGGMWLITDYKGEFLGMPFEGHGVQGYDADKRKYVQIWVDPMSVSMDVNEGTYDAATKTFKFKGKAKDPASGKVIEYSMKTVIESRDRHVFTMDMTNADGKPESLKIEYARKK